MSNVTEYNAVEFLLLTEDRVEMLFVKTVILTDRGSGEPSFQQTKLLVNQVTDRPSFWQFL